MRYITLMLAAVLLTGCGAATATSPPASTPTTAPAAQRSGGKTPMSRAEAGRYYLAMANRFNPVLARCTTIETKSELYDNEIQSALAACRKLPAALAESIRSIEHPPAPWPVEAREAISNWIDVNRSFTYCFKQLGHAKTIDDYYRAGQSCPNMSDDRSADLVRAHLGLPAAPTS